MGAECLQVSEEKDKTSFQSREYYLRLVDSTNNLVAVAGRQPKDLLLNETQRYWQHFIDANNHHYHQVSIMLHTEDFQIWGYLQVGA